MWIINIPRPAVCICTWICHAHFHFQFQFSLFCCCCGLRCLQLMSTVPPLVLIFHWSIPEDRCFRAPNTMDWFANVFCSMWDSFGSLALVWSENVIKLRCLNYASLHVQLNEIGFERWCLLLWHLVCMEKNEVDILVFGFGWCHTALYSNEMFFPARHVFFSSRRWCPKSFVYFLVYDQK